MNRVTNQDSLPADLMKIITLLSAFLVFILSAFTYTDNKKQQAENYFQQGEEEKALELYKDIVDEHSEDIEVVWITAMLYTRVGDRLTDSDKQQTYFDRAITLSERALEMDDTHPEAHFTYAVTLGRMTDNASTKDALAKAKKIRDHSKRTLELDENHGGAMHVLGLWHKRMANLSFTERAIVNTLFGGVPEGASNEKAEEYLNKAVEFSDDMILYNLDLARFLADNGDQLKAKQLLEDLLAMDNQFKDDPGLKKEAKDLLSQL